MKHLKTRQELNESSENLNISDVSDSDFINVNNKLPNMNGNVLIKLLDGRIIKGEWIDNKYTNGFFVKYKDDFDFNKTKKVLLDDINSWRYF